MGLFNKRKEAQPETIIQKEVNYEFKGFKPKIEVYKIGIDNVKEVQQVMTNRVYNKEELIGLNKVTLENMNLSIFDDVVVIEIEQKESKETMKEAFDKLSEMRFYTGSIVKGIKKDIETYEPNSFLYYTQEALEQSFQELKQVGAISGPNSSLFNKSWGDLIDIFRPRNIFMARQFDFYSINIQEIKGNGFWVFS